MLNYFPKYFTSKAILLYIALLLVCSSVFYNYILPPVWWIFGIVEAVGFFYFSNRLTLNWKNYTEKKFLKKLFITALTIRLVWVVFSYWFYTFMTGKPFEFSVGDAMFYHESGSWIKDLLTSGQGIQPFLKTLKGGGYSDAGYAIYLGVQYIFTGNSIIIARILKALYGAYTCILIYRLTTRNFGEETGRIASIFTMLMPNLILYTGLHLKEVEMVLISVWYIERADFLLRSTKLSLKTLIFVLLLAGSMFFFRTVLGVTALFALFTALIFSSNHLLNMGKRTILIIWVLVTVAYFVGGSISTEVESVWKARNINQDTSMEWRSERTNGNKFSKYASGVIFAPMIFVIPFPTVVNTPGQENQQLINGGNYVKNILAFFIFFALFMIIKEKKWRDYLLLGSFTMGYLLVIAMSAFAQSERFHQPALPFLLIFAAVGISKVTNNEKKYFKWWLAVIFVAIVAWSWFKLAGRGMV